jgi:hypothetical protein
MKGISELPDSLAKREELAGRLDGLAGSISGEGVVGARRSAAR